MKNTVDYVGSNEILGSHYSSVEFQNAYFKLALDIFCTKVYHGVGTTVLSL